MSPTTTRLTFLIFLAAILAAGCTESNPGITGTDSTFVPRFNDSGGETGLVGLPIQPGDRQLDGGIDQAIDSNDSAVADATDDAATDRGEPADTRPPDNAVPDRGHDGPVAAPPQIEHLALEPLRTVAVDVADADGDGRMDVALGYATSYLSSVNGRENAICFDVARSGFDKCRDIPETTLRGTASQTSAIAIRDMDRDGIQDIVSFNRFQGLIHRGSRALNGSVTFSRGLAFYFDINSCKGAHGGVSDLNGDGRLDLAYYELWLGSANTCSTSSGGSNSGDAAYRLQLADESGPAPARRFAAPVPLAIPGVGQNAHTSFEMVFGDLDSDRQLDVIVATNSPLGLYWFRNEGGAFAAAAQLPIAVPTRMRDLRVADVDKDGNVDLLIAYTGRTAAAVYYGAGDATFPVAVFLPATDAAGGTVGGIEVGDLDGDGLNDLIFERRYDDSGRDPRYYERIIARLGSNTRSFAAARTLFESEGGSGANIDSKIRAVRLDNNLRDDLVVTMGGRLDRIVLNPNVGR